MPAVENILSAHMAGTNPRVVDPKTFEHTYLKNDMTFNRFGKIISVQRFHSKIIKENKSVLTCHSMRKDVDGLDIVILDSVLTKPEVYIDIRRNILRITEYEYIRVISIKSCNFSNRGICFAYEDSIEINERTGALRFPDKTFKESMFTFAECIEKNEHPLKDIAYDIVIELIDRNYDIFTNRRYGLNKSELKRYKESLISKAQPVTQPKIRQTVWHKPSKNSEPFWHQTIKEFYEVFCLWQSGEIPSSEYSTQTGSFFRFLADQKGVPLT